MTYQASHNLTHVPLCPLPAGLQQAVLLFLTLPRLVSVSEALGFSSALNITLWRSARGWRFQFVSESTHCHLLRWHSFVQLTYSASHSLCRCSALFFFPVLIALWHYLFIACAPSLEYTLHEAGALLTHCFYLQCPGQSLVHRMCLIHIETEVKAQQ